MVATVGSISVDLAVKSAAFEQGFKRAGSTVDRESARMAKSVGVAERSISGLATAAGRLAGAFGGALAAREIVQYADAWTVAGNKIAAAGESADRQARSLSALNDIATETRSGISETVDLYAKLLRATAGVAKSEQEVATATEIVNKAFKAGGAAAGEQAAGILQLSQALSSGVLQGDELRSLRENAPLIAQAIAREFNTTIGGLKELGATGQLTAERVFKAILSAQKEIEAQFSQTEATIGEGLTLIRNAGTELIGTLSEVTGGAGSLAGELQGFATELERMSDAIRKFANDPSVRGFFEDLLGGSVKEGSLVDQIIDGAIGRGAAEISRDIAAVTEELATLKEAKDKLIEGDPSSFGFSNAISEANIRLQELQDELEGVQAASQAVSHGSFAELARAAEDASMRALRASQGIKAGMEAIGDSADDAGVKVTRLGMDIAGLKDKTVTITVKTVEVSGGGSVTVSSGTVDPETLAKTNPLSVDATAKAIGGASVYVAPVKSINVKDYLGYADGGFTGHKPDDMVAGVVHGGEFVFDAETTKRIGVGNLEAIQRGVRGYQDGGAVGAVSSILGRDTLSMVEENTYRTAEEVVRLVGYMQAMVDDGRAALSVLKTIDAGIGGLAQAIGSLDITIASASSAAASGGSSSSSSSGSGTSTTSGGSSSSSSGNTTTAQERAANEGLMTGYYQGQEYQYYSYSDPKAPYHWEWFNGGMIPYDPVADYLYNGNMAALDLIKDEGTRKSLLAQGTSRGTYSHTGALNITTDNDFTTAGRFATGGMIHAGDTQPVSFFKNPDEAVGIFKPDQMRAIGDAMGGSSMAVHYHAAAGNPDPSPRAMMEMRDRIRQTVREVMGGL